MNWTAGQRDGETAGHGVSRPAVQPSSRLFLTLATTVLFATQGVAQQSHLVVISGISGTPEHAERFNDWSREMIDGVQKLGVPPANIIYLSEQPPTGTAYAVGTSNKEEVEKAFGDLAAKAAPDDVILVLLIGHGSATAGESRFNLPGPDLTAKDFARLLDKFPSQRVALVNAASASGDFVAALSKKGRTIVTATRSGGEKNETVFAQYFVQAYAAEGADADKDGRISVLEAFEYARREVTRFYETEHRIQTEHALIDDNGDGQGSREPNLATGDGAIARRLVLTDGPADQRTGNPADSVLAPLYAEVRKLEEAVATLRAKKDSLKAEVYEAQLEDLLVQLAEKNQAIREREKKP